MAKTFCLGSFRANLMDCCLLIIWWMNILIKEYVTSFAALSKMLSGKWNLLQLEGLFYLKISSVSSPLWTAKICICAQFWIVSKIIVPMTTVDLWLKKLPLPVADSDHVLHDHTCWVYYVCTAMKLLSSMTDYCSSKSLMIYPMLKSAYVDHSRHTLSVPSNYKLNYKIKCFLQR